MACEDCDRARRCTEYRVFSLGCPFCGARYLQTLKSWPPPRQIGDRLETTAERKEWRAQVLRDWVGWGHDRQALEDMAAGEKVPFEPLERRRADDANPPQDGKRGKRARPLAGKAPADQGGARGDRVDAQGQAAAAAAGGGDDDQGGAFEWA